MTKVSSSTERSFLQVKTNWNTSEAWGDVKKYIQMWGLAHWFNPYLVSAGNPYGQVRVLVALLTIQPSTMATESSR